MSKLYPSKVNWKDEPSTETPLNAYNLNKMEQGIVNVAEAVDGNLEDVDTLKADMDLANKRIDEISKLPQGSTTGDAELADIRVGYNGKTYDTAGNSVRGQIKDLHDSLQLSNAVGNSLSLNTSIGGIRINEIEGVTVKDDSGLRTSGSTAYDDKYALVVEEKGKNELDVDKVYSNKDTFVIRGNEVEGLCSYFFTYGRFVFTEDMLGKTYIFSFYAKSKDGSDIVACAEGTIGGVRKSFSTTTISKYFVKISCELTPTVSGDWISISYNGAFGPKTMIAKDIQIELGSTATQYTPYKSNTVFIPLSKPLYSVGDLHDTIVKKDGKWGVERRCGSVDLGSLEWEYNSSNSRFDCLSSVSNIKSATSNIAPNLICKSYTSYSFETFYGGVNNAISQDRTFVRVRDLSFSDVSSFKNANANNILIYELATPYFEEITDQSTLYQLESYADKTYIDTAEGLAVLDVEYGQSAIVAEMLRTQNMESIRKANDKSVFSSRRFILIGDSYGEGYNSGLGYGWCKMFKDMYGLSDFDCYIKFEGGAGFVNPSNAGNTFISLLQQVIPEVENKDTITDIVVLGGFNDQYHSESTIGIAITSGFMDVVNNNFPNATVDLGFVGWKTAIDALGTINGLKNAYTAYIKSANVSPKIKWLNNMEYIMHIPTNVSNDNFHPNGKGITELAQGLYSALNDNLNVFSDGYEMEIYIKDGYTLTEGYVHTGIHNGNSHIGGNFIVSFNDSPVQFDLEYYILGAVKNSTIAGKERDAEYLTITADCFISFADGTFATAIGAIVFNGYNIFMRIPMIADDKKGIGWEKANVSEIMFNLHHTVVDSMIQ